MEKVGCVCNSVVSLVAAVFLLRISFLPFLFSLATQKYYQIIHTVRAISMSGPM